MKKAFILTALLFSSSVFADGLQVVKQIYANVDNSRDVLLKNATPDLKSVFAEDERYANGNLGCIDYDVVVQGQDYDARLIRRTFKATALPNGNVQVSFKNFDPVQLVYVMKQVRGKWLVDDILKQDTSFKRRIRSCIRSS